MGFHVRTRTALFYSWALTYTHTHTYSFNNQLTSTSDTVESKMTKQTKIIINNINEEEVKRECKPKSAGILVEGRSQCWSFHPGRSIGKGSEPGEEYQTFEARVKPP